MTSRAPAILGREVVCSGYLNVSRLRIRLATGVIVTREVERHGDAAAVLPYDAARRCALVAQIFRAPVFEATGAETLDEACAGMIEQDDAAAAARREAWEELGVVLTRLEPVARIWSSPGVSTERQSLFLAEYVPADRRGGGGGAAGENEDIIVLERPLAALAQDVDTGRVSDGKLLTLMLALRLRRPGLFA
jgi:nudix-type nucleoside diphosphatase (YffH/AdpP family)